jgi:hypothetical protein
MAKISEFINNFKGGIRANRFRINTAGDVAGSKEIHVIAASIPQMQIIDIPINFRGKAIHYPGSRGFIPWTFTVRDDTTGTARHKSFMDWSNSFISTGENFGTIFSAEKINTNVWTVEQLADTDTSGGVKVIRTFKLKKCWPMEIGPLVLDMSQDTGLATFQVQLAYIELE